jgi:hypothetical protein
MEDIGVTMANSNLMILFMLLIFGYFVLYFGGRKYLEKFQNNDYDGQPRFNPDGSPNEQQNMMIYPPEKPYLMNPIDDLDDYELSLIFKNQGSKTASKKQISDAMTRYPMDWSVQGPDSQYFQDNQAQFEKKVVENIDNPPPTKMYNEINGSDMTPLDTAAFEAEEKKILQTYKPECSKGLLQYSVDDVRGLVDKIYGKKDLIPVIEKSKQGENIWEITEVKEKHPHIVWEDDLERQTERQRMEKRGEEVIEVPYTAQDIAAGLDPFFQARNPTRDGKFDYYQWTPGLERMFAPTYPIKEWY